MKVFTTRAALLLAVLPFVLYLGYAALDYWIEHKTYTFSTADIARAANEARMEGGTPEEMMRSVERILSSRYPGIIQPESSEWVFIRAGGWMGAFKLLYSSLTEYVLLFGTAIPTSGHSGRYFANITDTLLCGSMLQWEEGAVTANKWGPGDTVPHAKWTATGVAWPADTWMVEHAHGLIPTTMPFAFADGIISAQDFASLWKAVRVYATQVLGNMMAGRL